MKANINSFSKKILKHDWTKIFLMFLASRLVLTIIGLISRAERGLIETTGISMKSLTDIFVQWDSGWYLDIIKNGYVIPVGEVGVEQASYAFFPLYPFLVRGLATITNIDPVLLSEFLSNAFLFGSLIILYELIKGYQQKQTQQKIKTDSDTKKIAMLATIIVLASPVSFLFSSILTESLYLFLSLLSIYLLRKRFVIFGILIGFLVALTRSVGVLIIIPLLFEYLQLREINLQNLLKNPFSQLSKLDYRVLFFATIPFATVIYGYYIYTLTGEPFAILQIQSAWERESVNPFWVLVSSLFSGELKQLAWIGSAWLTLLVIISGWRKIPWFYLLYSIILIMMPLTNSSLPHHLSSMPRYALVIFPVYWITAIYMNKLPLEWQYAIIMLLGIIQGGIMALWAVGAWVVI